MSKHHLRLLVVLGLAAVLASGCTKAIDFAYQSDMQRLGNAEKLEKVSIGIAKFEDKRSWTLSEGQQSESYVALQGPWKFGLTYEGKDYVPVKDVVQSIFVLEFGKAGLQVKPVDRVLSKSNKSDMRGVGEQNGFQYVLGGEIFVFEFVNEPGFWTVSSRRAVTLSLLLLNVKDDTTVLDNTFSENQIENEGMGVKHSTNVNKLMNGVFKKVVKQVVEQVAAKMAVSAAAVHVQVAYSGWKYEFALDKDRFVLVGSVPALQDRS